jgi:hypothetical protein
MIKEKIMKKAIISAIFLLMMFTAISGIKVDPVFERQYLDEASTIFSMGRYKMALKLYYTVFQMNSDNIEAVTGIANCHAMMGEEKPARVNYNLAKSMDPKFEIPDLSRYQAMELERSKGKSQEELKRSYYSLFPAMKNEKAQTAVKETMSASAVTPSVQTAAQTAATPAAPSAKVAAGAEGPATVLTEADVKKMTVTEKNKPDMSNLTNEQAQMYMDDREYDYRGGHAKMESLGGMKHIIPDSTTSMDGGYYGLDTALLFRKKTHVFNLEPFYGLYTRDTDYPGGVSTGNRTQLITMEDSLGELNSPNEYFFNRVQPMLSNSFTDSRLSTGVPDIDQRAANTGSNFGGVYTLGFKPISLYGMTFSAGYEYSPYYVDSQSGTITTNTTVSAMQFFWNAGAGVCFPYIFTKTDQLQANISYGSYRPQVLLADITNDTLFDMPYSMINDYSQKITESGFDELNLLRYADSKNLEATGNDVKADVHYMIGNNEHEVFLYVDFPHNIKYNVSRTLDLLEEGSDVAISSTVIAQEEAGSEKRWNGTAGFRDNFKYVTVGVKYELASRETYYTTTYTADFMPPALVYFDHLTPEGMMQQGREYERDGRLILGINVTPIDLINIPMEYEINQYYLSTGGMELVSNDSTIRVGLQIKPTPFFAIRGGISYETLRNDILSGGKTIIGDPGTDPNPALNILGYHFGAGIDMPLFEFNVGGAVKTIYKNPLPSAISSEVIQYMYGYVDFNIYI